MNVGDRVRHAFCSTKGEGEVLTLTRLVTAFPTSPANGRHMARVKWANGETWSHSVESLVRISR